jgi:hypothetical protein
MKYALLVALMIITAKSAGQVASHTATTDGCKTVIVGHDNTINCGALTIDEANKLAAILNEVRNSNLSLDVVLGKLDAILAEIRRNENPNRAVVSYSPNGNKLTTYAGHFSTDDGEYQIFAQEMGYEQQKQWQNEADLAEKEERNVPEWLTPLMFAADAYANLCRIKDAASNLNDFITKASDEPAYEEMISKANQHLTQLPRMAEQCHVSYP